MNLIYAIDYVTRALSGDDLEQPNQKQAEEAYEVLLGLYYGSKANGKKGAKIAWETVKANVPKPLLMALEMRNDALIHADDLKNMSMPEYLMSEYPIYNEAFNVIVGPSGGGKSFVALDIAGRLAMNYPIIYIAGEGLAGYAARWEAWKAFHHVEGKPELYFYKEALQLLDDIQLVNFVSLLQQHNPYLVIVDTLARSAVGIDENSARDMGMLVSACDKLRTSLNCGIIVVHHTGKSGDMRGSTALYGASDSVMNVSKIDGLVRITNRQDFGGKNKYGEDNFEAWYKITPHEVDGFNGAVLVPAEKIKDFALELNDKETALLEALANFADEGASFKALSSKLKQPKATIYRLIAKLKDKHFISKDKELYFIEAKGLEALETLGLVGSDESEEPPF